MTKWLGSLPVAVSEPGFSYMLTPWTRVMAPALARHANDELVARYLTPQFPHPYTMDHAFGYISYATTTTSEDILAIVRVNAATLEQEAIGSIGMIYSNDDDTAKFGYWLGQAHWGKGVASAAVHSFLTGVISNDNDRRGVKLVEASVYVGGVLNRLRHGQGTYTFPGGYYKYTGDWELGKMHGHGIFFLGDGSTYEGTFVHGEMQGMGLRRWPDGTTFSGEFCRGEMHGEGTFIASSGKRYEGAWRDNQHHGKSKSSQSL
ncbi:hypothetical protein DYB37_006798 [Aphanomyces astaci]|uniref:N-acetyltransferase domain-containing protein n=1 Tax=Aphanomyces astaci TaxID=112090 RepID=A0A418DFY0_APHAT|nr:hypothetical protein DYB35_007894 [Aphanomyces astaci]RHZ32484.1 hypothetical protein DYB37_006798 [Aphanomyces astaci]